MKRIAGLPASQGYAKGEIVLWRSTSGLLERETGLTPEQEEEKFQGALNLYGMQLKDLDQALDSKPDVDHSQEREMIRVYQMFLGDEFLWDKVRKAIREENLGAAFAVSRECKKMCDTFSMVEDPYLRERAADIRHVGDALVNLLAGRKETLAAAVSSREDVVVVADDLSPMVTMQLDKTKLRALITEEGGVTSHTAILAKSMGIPALVGTAGILQVAREGEEILVDGNAGVAILSPSEEERNRFFKKMEQMVQEERIYQEVAGRPSITRDGRTIQVNINIGDQESLAGLSEACWDGVGLFRTEFLFLGRTEAPDEETQYAIYREVAQQAGEREVIIRTLDIGGDKEIPYLGLPKEENPFLGYRAIRICLERPDIFLPQLRALLRAAVYGNIKIMFPMVVKTEEILAAKRLLQEAKDQLRQEGIPFREDLPVGIMIETPAAVLLSDMLAQQVDFFSIGTNDLIQYTTASDRLNERVQSLYDSMNLSVLRSIVLTVKNAHKQGIPVGICGEMASESPLLPLWVALEVDELSVVPSQVGKVKYLIGHLDPEHSRQALEMVMKADTIQPVKELLSQLTAATRERTP